MVFSVLVAGEFVVELLFRELLSPFLLRTKTLWDGEEGHDRVVVQTVGLHLFYNLHGIGHRLWHITEDIVHLLLCLEPLLLGVEHTRRVVQILTRGEAQQMVVGFSILLIHEMGIVGADQFDAIFLGQFDEHLVGLLLQGEGLTVGTDGRICHLMALEFQIIIIAPKALVPLDGLAGTLDVALQDLCWYLSCDTGRTDDQVFVVFFQFLAVCTRTVIEAIHPGITYQFDQVLVTVIVFGEYDEMVAA